MRLNPMTYPVAMFVLWLDDKHACMGRKTILAINNKIRMSWRVGGWRGWVDGWV